MPDNHTNLPILDDIIKPGDTDKAVRQPSSKVQSSLWPDEQRNDASAAGNDNETSANPAVDDDADTTGLFTDDQSASDVIDANEILENADETRAPVIDLPDIDTLTEEILDNLILQIEPLLRDRIRQTLSRHFAGDAGSD
jgi:hypothetical protein